MIESPLDCWKRPDLHEQLRAHPVTRPYSLDSGFIRQVDELAGLDSDKDQQKMGAMIMNDPRLTQAVSALQGWNLTVSEKETKHAESVGNMPKRDAVQMPHYEYAHTFTTPQAAKEAGNVCFKDGRYPEALACWARVRQLYGELLQQGPEALKKAGVPPPDPALPTMLHSNAAAALLKMERPDEALTELDGAISTAPLDYDLSKVHHRQAQAHEAVAKRLVNPEKAAVEMAAAVESGKLAVAAAKAAGAAAKNEWWHLEREHRRLKAADKEAQEAAEKARKQRAKESEATARRETGIVQDTPASSRGGAIIAQPTVGYVRDIDLSGFAAGWLKKEVCSCALKWGDGEIAVVSLDAAASDIHVSIKEKRGKRALYYDLTLNMSWRGKSRVGRGKESYGSMDGVLRMYNIGQDTKFELGGDKETSYMYELGLPKEYHGACEPWATQVKEKAADLFEEAALLITSKFVAAVEAKGELIK